MKSGRWGTGPWPLASAVCLVNHIKDSRTGLPGPGFPSARPGIELTSPCFSLRKTSLKHQTFSTSLGTLPVDILTDKWLRLSS